MVRKKTLSPEQRQALEQDREELWKKVSEIDEEAERYLQAIFDSVGNKPVVRNPDVKKHPDYKRWERQGFFKSDPGFWEINPTDEPKMQAITAAWRHGFTFNCLLKPGE